MLQNITSLFRSLTVSQATLGVLGCFFLYAFYTHFTDPLKHIPGPWYARWSRLWLSYHTFMGDETRLTSKLHAKYGPVVRISPDDVDIVDGEALWTIYMDKGGFEKPGNYNVFDIDGHPTIFASRTLAHRAPRVKSVLPLFSLSAIRDATPIFHKYADKFIDRMQRRTIQGSRFDILDLCRAFALDTVSETIFGTSFGALEYDSIETEVSPCVDAFISVSKYFHMPVGVGTWMEDFEANYLFNRSTRQANKLVDDYVRRMVTQGKVEDKTFQSRMLDRGGAETIETIAQVKDALFAGTDSTGNNLATILWFLARQPETYNKLYEEIVASDPEVDVMTLPYLVGVVKEALRLSMSISTRLPRCVPEGGWTYMSSPAALWTSEKDPPQTAYYFPEGTSIGVPAYSLHLNPTVFPDPELFQPERWTDPSSEMNRDWIPFGKGARSCIARNLAQVELAVVVSKLMRADILRGVRAVGKNIERRDWFLSRIVGDVVELDASSVKT